MIYLFIVLLWLFAGLLTLVAGEAVAGATASDWLTNPEAAAKNAGATAAALESYGAGFWASVASGTLIILALAKQYSPIIARIIPVWGPVVESVANIAWAAMATPQQKQADVAAQTARQAAQIAKPLLDELRSLPLDQLPASLRVLVQSQGISDAIGHLSDPQKKA